MAISFCSKEFVSWVLEEKGIDPRLMQDFLDKLPETPSSVQEGRDLFNSLEDVHSVIKNLSFLFFKPNRHHL